MMNSKKSLFVWVLTRTVRGVCSRTTSSLKAKYPPSLEEESRLVCELEGGLLMSSNTFCYFMVVALESSGGFLRAFLLLLLYPFLPLFAHEVRVRMMVLICFIGLQVESFHVGKAVLPKYLLEDVGVQGLEVLRRAKRRVCVTSMPSVMVQAFLKDYLEVDIVVGRKLKVSSNGYYTGFMEDAHAEILHGDLDHLVWFGGNHTLHPHLMSLCKEVYCSLTEYEKKKTWHPLPKSSYPKPLIFHDGRLAFKPTPLATLAMFLWLPFGFPLAFIRGIIGHLAPLHMKFPLIACMGMQNRLLSSRPTGTPQQLFVCNHRTLLDPVYVEANIGHRVSAVTYSLSRVSEVISPIRTVRLTRNRDEDKRRMKQIVESNEGGVVVCPEGTTCREPYLLRFSPLFTEICNEVTPVALETHVTMFYGTSTSAFKFLDPLYFFLNPSPCYDLEFLDAVDCRGNSNIHTANYVQGEIGRVLGFQCTRFTRKDKYLMLAGNEGIVNCNSK